jgi:16S rRNA C1402 (ribose-2'-O) methylase RsmI
LQILDVNAILENMICAYFRFSINAFELNTLWAVLIILDLLTKTLMPHQFWRGTLGEAKEVFSSHQPKGEITLLIEGKTKSTVETPSECQLENELRNLISSGHSLSTVMTSSQEFTKFKFF